MTSSDLDVLVSANTAHTTRYYCRLLRLAEARQRRRMQSKIEVPDTGILDQALAQGRGAILVTGHIGEFDLAASWLAQVRGVPVVVPVSRIDALRQPLFDRLRHAAGIDLRPATITTLRHLELELAKNCVVVTMIDRGRPAGGCETHFLGRPAAVSRAPALLAMRSGAPVVTGATYSIDRRSLLAFLSLHEAPLRARAHARARVDALTRALVADIEALIAAHPEQWHVPADLTQLPWLAAT